MVFLDDGSDTSVSYSGMMGLNSAANLSPVPSVSIGPNQIYFSDNSLSGIAVFNDLDTPWNPVDGTSITGDPLGYYEYSPGTIVLFGPADFTSTTVIDGVALFANKTLADFGLSVGDSGTLSSGAFVINWSATVSAVPEPAAVGALGGAACLVFTVWYQRRRRPDRAS